MDIKWGDDEFADEENGSGGSERFISHWAKYQSLKPHLKLRFPKASIISTIHTYKELMIKLVFMRRLMEILDHLES